LKTGYDEFLDDNTDNGAKTAPKSKSKRKVSIGNTSRSRKKQNTTKSKSTKNKIEKVKTPKQSKGEVTHSKTKIKKIENYQKNKRIFKLKILLVIIVVIAIMIVIFSSSLFNLKNLEITNNNIVTSENIKSLAEIEDGINIFRVNTKLVSEKIKKNSYIESVKIKRKLPDTIEIEVTERVRRYMLQVADSYIYINNQGYMLEVSTEKLDLPIITGFKTDLSNAKSGDRLDVEDLENMEMIIKIMETATNNDIGNLITKIDISDEKNYIIELASENKKAYLGDCSNLNTRILTLKAIIEQEKGNSGTAFINMDLNTGRAYFRAE
jgi:cell division protein FtsQ